jgi:hypothetical protein
MELIMNYPGCFGSHPEDIARAKELDRYLDSNTGWTADDIATAKSELFDCIRDGGEEWDENLTGYRLDMLTDIENIMYSRIDRREKLAEIEDVMDKYIKRYCDDKVEHDQDAYCSRFCSASYED